MRISNNEQLKDEKSSTTSATSLSDKYSISALFCLDICGIVAGSSTAIDTALTSEHSCNILSPQGFIQEFFLGGGELL